MKIIASGLYIPVDFSQGEMQAYLLVELCEVFIGAVEHERRGLALPVYAQRVHVVLLRVVALLVPEAFHANQSAFLGHAVHSITIFHLINYIYLYTHNKYSTIVLFSRN